MNIVVVWKKVLLALSVVGVVLLSVLLLVSGQWKALERQILQIGIRKRKIELNKLDLEQSKRAEELSKDDAKVKALDEQRKQLQKDNLTSELQMKGMTHEQVVAELARHGF